MEHFCYCCCAYGMDMDVGIRRFSIRFGEYPCCHLLYWCSRIVLCSTVILDNYRKVKSYKTIKSFFLIGSKSSNNFTCFFRNIAFVKMFGWWISVCFIFSYHFNILPFLRFSPIFYEVFLSLQV